MARKAPIEFVFAQIKADNAELSRFLTSSNCQAGTPAALSGDASGKNTAVTITGIAGNGFRDSVTFNYDRVTLADMIAASTTGNTTNVVPNTNQSSLADMVASFNAAYGSNLQVSDVQPASLGSLPGGYYGLTLTPVDGHYLFNGGTVLKYRGTFASLALSGTFTTPTNVGDAYHSTLSITGGTAPYSNARVGSGALPSGLTLSVSGNTVALDGQGVTMGTYGFTVKVDSDDGQTATSGTQTVIIDGELDKLISHPTLTGLDTTDTAGKDSVTAFFARLNADNPTLPLPLSSINATLGSPSALSGDSSLRNTSITVTGKAAGYVNSNTIKYNRVDLATVNNGVLAVSWVSQTSSSDLLTTLNTAAGTSLTVADIVVEALPTNPHDGSVTAYTLKAATGSVAFRGQMTVNLTATVSMTVAGFFSTTNLTEGTAFSSQLPISGGVGPYTVAVQSPTGADYSSTFSTLGLSVSTSGNNLVYSGTPASGSRQVRAFKVVVTDSKGNTATTAVQSIMISNGSAPTGFTSNSPLSVPSTDVALSNGNLTATRVATNNGLRMVRSGQQLTTIRFYEEFRIDQAASTGTYIGASAYSSANAPSFSDVASGSAPGTTSGVQSASFDTTTGRVWFNGGSTLYSNVTAFVAGDVLGVAIDATVRSAVKVWWSKNGTWIQGNPSTGDSPMAVLDWLTNTASGYMGLSTFLGTAPRAVVTWRSAGAAQTYAVPAGFVRGML